MNPNTPPAAAPRLFRSLLGPAFEQLADANRAMHMLPGQSVAKGQARVERGHHPLAWLIGAIAGMPKAAEQVSLQVRFDSISPELERWSRQFGERQFSSRLSLEQGDLVERLFPLHLRFRLQLDQGVLHWQLQGARILGWISMPAWFAPKVEAREWSEQGRYHFLAAVSLPLLGLIVRYQGSLDPPEPVPD